MTNSSKWYEIEKGAWGLSSSIVIFNKVRFYVGVSDSWGIALKYCHYDMSLTIDLLKWYAGVEVFHEDEF